MIADLGPYPAMKDSGVRWLGEVPEHWEVQRLGHIGTLLKGSGGNKDDEVADGVPCVRYGDLYTTHSFFITAARSRVTRARARAYTPIRYGDVLFAGSGETIDEIGKSAVNLILEEAVCGGDVILFRSSADLNARFLGYSTDCRPAAAQKAQMGRGITVMHIYGDELKRLVLAIPSRAEQDAIVRFLEHADRRIRRYIRAKQKLIKVLEEQKQAIIHRAVTRGLDPNIRLKPSGVPWLGDVPEHWEVMRLARVIADGPRNGISPPVDERGTIESFSISAIRDGHVDVRDRDKKYIWGDKTALERTYCLLRGDVLLVRGNGNIRLVGKAGLVEESMLGRVYPDLLMRVRLTRRCLPRFLVAWLNSSVGHDQIETAARTAVGTFKINNQQVRQLCCALPPVAEQQRIVDCVSDEWRTLKAVSYRAEAEVVLLRELRIRLIADVVTGKLDVREAAARLPDEDDEPEASAEADAMTAVEDDTADDLDALSEEAEV